MMIVSEKWRETSQKSVGPFEAMCPCHMLYRLKQQSMMSMGILWVSIFPEALHMKL